MDGQSLNVTEERIRQLRQIFPDVFSEDKIDFNRLRAVLGENVLFPGEHYELSWAGKADARREVQRQTTTTLIPDPEGSVDFDNAQNIFIEGENLEVLRVLQKSYFGKVKMICIDPPYNTGNDSFVYPDDFAERQEDYLKRTGAKDEEGFLNKQDLWKKNSKENGQFHSAWLSMMYPRLYLARNLMREDGVIFVSIDDNEAANLRLLMDEVFGEENFVAQLVWQKKTGAGAKTKTYITLHEYIFCYARNLETLGEIEIPFSDKSKQMYSKKDEHFEKLGPYATWPLDTTSMDTRENLRFPIIHEGIEIWPRKQWLWSKERVMKAQKENKLVFNFNQKEGTYSVRFKGYLFDEDGNEKRGKPLSMLIGPYTQEGTKDFEEMFNRDIFPFPKPVRLLKQLLNLYLGSKYSDDDIVLDFFAGSSTTAQAVMELNAEDGGNRRFILVQMPEPLEENSEAWKAGYRSIADIGRARIRKVIERLRSQAAEKAKTPGLFEASENAAGQVLGFQSYRLQYSNFKLWRNDLEGKEAILNQLQIFQEPLSEYRGKHSALLTELILKAGFPLTVKVTEKDVDGCSVFDVDNGRMWAALDKVTPNLFQVAAEARPSVFVTLSGFFTGASADETMANANLQLKDAGVDFKVI